VFECVGVRRGEVPPANGEGGWSGYNPSWEYPPLIPPLPKRDFRFFRETAGQVINPPA
jgi:hypothetical protein